MQHCISGRWYWQFVLLLRWCGMASTRALWWFSVCFLVLLWAFWMNFKKHVAKTLRCERRRKGFESKDSAVEVHFQRSPPATGAILAALLLDSFSVSTDLIVSCTCLKGEWMILRWTCRASARWKNTRNNMLSLGETGGSLLFAEQPRRCQQLPPISTGLLRLFQTAASDEPVPMTKVEAKFVEGKVKTLPFSALVTAGRERGRKYEGKVSWYQFVQI